MGTQRRGVDVGVELAQRPAAAGAEPVEPINDALERLLREAAADTGKQVQAVVRMGSQSDLEPDARDLVREIAVQLARNAVVHGIEAPPERQATGKDAAGKVQVELVRGETEWTLSVRDDGCGIPAYAFPLQALAWSIARFGAPETLPENYAAAATRLAQAITNAPWYIAGTTRFCTVAMEALKGRVIVKAGAEGVFMAAFPAKKLGVALKIRDGAARAAEVLMAGLIRRIEGIDLADYPALNELAMPTLRTRTGEPTGLIRLAADAGI